MNAPRRFSCDPAKNARNIGGRGIDLLEGAKAFDFETAVVAIDDRKDYGEVRKIAAGFVGPRIHIIVFTMRGETCHVISLRKANKREIRRYAEKA